VGRNYIGSRSSGSRNREWNKGKDS